MCRTINSSAVRIHSRDCATEDHIESVSLRVSPLQPRRPLERRRDWVVTILGLITVGIGGGYLLEGKLVAWPLLISLGVFIVALNQRHRR
jgi:hypothetical protein